MEGLVTAAIPPQLGRRGVFGKRQREVSIEPDAKCAE